MFGLNKTNMSHVLINIGSNNLLAKLPIIKLNCQLIKVRVKRPLYKKQLELFFYLMQYNAISNKEWKRNFKSQPNGFGKIFKQDVRVNIHKNFEALQQYRSNNDDRKRGVKTKYPSWLPSPQFTSDKIIKQYKKLSKFRLTSLVVITAMGGYVMAPAPFNLTTFTMCSLGTCLVSAGANAINQYHEVPFDSQMSRTKSRVLVTGQLTPLHAVGFAISSATLGLCLLHFGVNGFAAALGAINLFLYTSVYTPLKRISILNTWMGSIVGAIPPLIGWAGCAGTLNLGAFLLAGVLYAWQFPHFNALSWNLRPDYSRAGYRMMAVTNPGLCKRTALRYTLAINCFSLLAPAIDVTNAWFALESLPLNGYFSYLAYKFYRNADSGTSRKLFRFSLLHLPILMLLFLFNKKHWYFANTHKEPGNENDKSPFPLLQLPSPSELGKVLPATVILDELTGS